MHAPPQYGPEVCNSHTLLYLILCRILFTMHSFLPHFFHCWERVDTDLSHDILSIIPAIGGITPGRREVDTQAENFFFNCMGARLRCDLQVNTIKHHII